MRRSAVISDDGRYRYQLGRRWNTRAVRAVFIMLNPSTADADVDDPTIRRCVSFAHRWGMGGMWVVNLYAFRATNPRELWLQDDPIGPENDAWIERAIRYEALVVAAWGANARPDRVEQVLRVVGAYRLQCLGTTKDGHPRHPLYVRNTTPLQPWQAPS